MQNSSVEDNYFSVNKMLNLQGTLMDLSIPKIMGIINLNDNSFYSNSRILDGDELLRRIDQFVEEGVDIIDIGAQSTRPGAKIMDESTEIQTVTNVIKSVRSEYPKLPISVDTFRGSVAQQALESGANIINDVSGFSFDTEMLDVIGRYKSPYILMHLSGDLQSMHSKFEHENITKDVINYFSKKIEILLKHGINDIIIDPGFGFSKTNEENFQLLKQLDLLQILEKPILVGFSRKRMIYNSLDISVDEALNGTTVLNTLALTKGASILRVHDVKEASDVRKLWLLTQQ